MHPPRPRIVGEPIHVLCRSLLLNLVTQLRIDSVNCRESAGTQSVGACHYLTNQPPFAKASRSLQEGGASLLEGFAKPPRRLHEPFAEVAYTEGSKKTPWRVHEASSKGPWMNSRVFLLDDACHRVWSILYCFFYPLCFQHRGTHFNPMNSFTRWNSFCRTMLSRVPPFTSTQSVQGREPAEPWT